MDLTVDPPTVAHRKMVMMYRKIAVLYKPMTACVGKNHGVYRTIAVLYETIKEFRRTDRSLDCRTSKICMCVCVCVCKGSSRGQSRSSFGAVQEQPGTAQEQFRSKQQGTPRERTGVVRELPRSSLGAA